MPARAHLIVALVFSASACHQVAGYQSRDAGGDQPAFADGDGPALPDSDGAVDLADICIADCGDGTAGQIVPANVGAAAGCASDFTLGIAATLVVDTDRCGGLAGFGKCASDEQQLGASGLTACVLRLRDFTIAGRLEVRGSQPLIIVARKIRLSGTIDVGAEGATPGPGGAPAALPPQSTIGVAGGHAGGVDGGGGISTCGDPSDDNGGAGGSFGTVGGTGGVESGCSAPASPTGISSNDALAPLHGGAAGGSAVNTQQDSEAALARGGAGGGALQLTALDELLIDGGTLNAGGGGGMSGDGQGQFGATQRAGGGGGSGGAILLEAPTISVAARGNVVAGGGGGGACVSGTDLPPGGQDGGATVAKGAPRQTSTGAPGGDGAFTGRAGKGGSVVACGSGGGGGAGILRFNVLDGRDPCGGLLCVGRHSVGLARTR